VGENSHHMSVVATDGDGCIGAKPVIRLVDLEVRVRSRGSRASGYEANVPLVAARVVGDVVDRAVGQTVTARLREVSRIRWSATGCPASVRHALADMSSVKDPCGLDRITPVKDSLAQCVKWARKEVARCAVPA
jgi:hypothetical protein